MILNIKVQTLNISLVKISTNTVLCGIVVVYTDKEERHAVSPGAVLLAHLSRRRDHNLSVVRRCRKLFTFSSSSPEPLGQFQPNLSQSILG